MKKLRQIYEDLSPLGQIVAFIVVMATIIFKGGAIWSRIDNYDARITAVETTSAQNSKGFAVIDQKLDDLNRNVAELTTYLLNKRVADGADSTVARAK